MVAACAVDAPPELARTEQQASVCADGPTVYGIDVSRFQGSIDWQKVKDSGVVFAYIQISRSLTDLDAKFDYNWRRAREVGVLRGAYQRFHPGQDVIGQANVFLDKLGTYQPGDLPPMLDVEDADGLSGAQVAAAVKKWMDHVEPKVGVKPMIYTGFYFWRDSVGSNAFAEHPLWIANYGATCPLVPDPWPKWTIHQYSSSARVPGITENTTDVNKFNGTIDQLKALGQPVAPAACPTIDATNNIIDDSSGCFSTGGPSQFIRSEPKGYGDTLKWTHATDSAEAANYGLWQLGFAEAGTYRVEAHTPAPYNQSKQAVYRVKHAGTTTDATVDQSAVDGWNAVGDFDFAAGDMQSIRVDDNTGEPSSTDTMIVFDALRFTRLDAPGGGSGDGGADGDVTSGCSSSRGTGLGMLFALLVVLARRPTSRTSRRSPQP